MFWRFGARIDTRDVSIETPQVGFFGSSSVHQRTIAASRFDT